MKNAYPETKDIGDSSRHKPDDTAKDNHVFPSAYNNGFFLLLAENARDLIFHAKTSPTFQFDYVSPSSTHITGYTPEEFYADPLLAQKCILPEDFHLITDPSAWDNSNKSKPVEIRWKRKDRRIIWTEHMISVTRDKKGKPESFHIIARDITERKKTQEDLAGEAVRRRILIEQSRDGIVIIDNNGKVYEANRRFADMLGYSPEEVQQLHVFDWEFLYPRERLLDMLRTVDEAGDHFETRHRRKDGTTYDVEISTNGATFAGQKLIFCVCRDITERIKLEETMERDRAEIKLIIDSSQALVFYKDKEGKFLRVNKAFAEALNMPEEDFVGKTVFDLYSVDIAQSMTDDDREVFESRRPKLNIVEQYESAAGLRWVQTDKMPVLDKNGEAIAMIGFAQDITERKRMEQALRESEEKFAAAFHSSPNSVCIVTVKEGTFLEVNESFLQFSGYSREEVIGHTPVELNLWVNEDDIKRMAKSLNETGKLDNEVVKSRMKSGEIRTGLFSADTIEIGGRRCMTLVITDITEQIQAKEALRESEEKFSVAFRASPQMMTISNRKTGKYIDVNDSYVNNTGYSREEFIGHSGDEKDMWVYPEELKRMARLMQEQEKIRNEEFSLRMKSGEIRNWLCSADVINIGGESCSIAVATDITERKKAQEALRESEEKFSKAFHASPSSISISRISDGKFIEVNDTFLRNKGYTREEVIGRTSIELNLLADKKEHTNIRASLKHQGKFVNREIQYHTKSGQIRTGLMSAEIINIGNEPCMIVINTDITQQKLAEKQLRLLSSVTQQVSDSTIITDPNFKITYINQAAQDMFGYNLDEVKGKSLSIFNKTNPTEEVKQAINEALAAGKVRQTTVPKKRKDGTTIICDCRLSPLYDEKGKICSIIDVQRDVTKQKEVETKLQEHKKLIDSILATTPEGVLVIDSDNRILLANKAICKIFHLNRRALKNMLLSEIFPTNQFFDLYKAVKRGENEKKTLEFRYQAQTIEKIIDCVILKMDGERTLLTFSDVSREREEEEKLYLTARLASIGEMAAGLAHELNNPLTGILALSQLLTSSDLPAEHKEDIECIYSEAKRAASIVKNVLLFARNRTGENGQASPNEVIKDVLRLREYEERTSNITVATNLEENLPDIHLEKGQFQQVLLNMISNAEAAIKEMNRPGVITVATQRVNNHVNITFSDNGCGIKKQIIPRIFDPFFTTKEIGKGTGLGLSICYSIIVKHGGKISVKSQVNEGATFTIRMPIVM